MLTPNRKYLTVINCTIPYLIVSFFMLTAHANEIKTPPDNAEDVDPISLESTIPEVELRTVENEIITLKEVIEGKKTLLVFYRGGWCMYCNMQLGNLATISEELKSQHIQIVAISPDKPSNLKSTIEEAELDYMLLSDSKANAAKAFGIAFRVDAQTRELYTEYGIDLEEASGESHHLLPVPAVFLVDTDETIRFVHVDPDYRERLSNEKLLEAVSGL